METYEKFIGTISKIKCFAKKHPKIFIVICVSLSFFSGFVGGKINTVKSSKYKEMQSALNDEIKLTQTELDTQIAKKNGIQSEFDTYKAKMQPYEYLQEADAQKAAEEKQAEEAKRQAEAEEAAKKAEEEAQRLNEEQKANSLGITLDEFYKNFNSIAATEGLSAFLGKADKTSQMCAYTTLDDTDVLCTFYQNNYLRQVSITIDRNSHKFVQALQEYPVTTIRLIDTSLSLKEIDTFLANLIERAGESIGEDVSITKNGIEYVANMDSTSIMIVIRK